jgi:hypothetical protein
LESLVGAVGRDLLSGTFRLPGFLAPTARLPPLSSALNTVGRRTCSRTTRGSSRSGFQKAGRVLRHPLSPSSFLWFHCVLCLFFHLCLGAGANLGQIVGAQDADRVDDDGKRDHQLDGCRDDLTRLQGDAADHHNGLRDTLGTQGSQEGGDNAIRQGGEKPGNDTPQVERSRKYDDILGIEHFVCKSG